jgi:hypothetical protein
MAVRMDTLASTYKYRDDQGLQHFVAELYADETSDISGVTTFGTIVADPNSVAYVVQSGKLYVMGGDSVWYDTEGNEVE